MLNFLRRFLIIAPDQILSTTLLLAFCYVFWRGVFAVWKNPPSLAACGTVIFIGVFVGFLATLKYLNENENDTKSD